MHEALSQNLFFIEEHVGLLKAANNYDVFDPRTQELVMNCREENLALQTQITRFSPLKSTSSFNIIVNSKAGDKILTVKRSGGMKPQKLLTEVLDKNDQLVGKFRPVPYFKGNFEVLNPENEAKYSINKVEDKEFTFTKGEEILAKISKKWAGASKELLTTADNYLLQVMVTVAPGDPLRQVIFASVLCIDMLLYE